MKMAGTSPAMNNTLLVALGGQRFLRSRTTMSTRAIS
jgi:hypothetical protein